MLSAHRAVGALLTAVMAAGTLVLPLSAKDWPQWRGAERLAVNAEMAAQDKAGGQSMSTRRRLDLVTLAWIP